MKIKTQDFQILKGENIFEFPVGITVIQGKTGSGKTSLFYAIEDCLLNPSGVDDAINWDAKNCKVTISNNDNEITWIKTSNSSQYINEKTKQEFVKASKLDSTDLADLGFYIKDNDVVNIQGEWKLLFPFDLKDTEMFRLFEDIFNISCSFLIIDEYKKDEQQIKSKINETVNNINELVRHKSTIEDILSKVDNIALNNLINNIQTTQNRLDDLRRSYQCFNNYNPYKDIKIPEEFNTANLQETYNKLHQVNRDFEELHRNLNLLKQNLFETKIFNLQEPTLIKDYENYTKFIQDKIKNENLLNSLVKEENLIQEQIDKIKVCPTCGRPL